MAKLLISFQELWRVVTGKSCMQEPSLVQEDLNNALSSFKLGLDYFKEYNQKSEDTFKKDSKSSKNLKAFTLRASKLLNLECFQTDNLIRQYANSFFHGSKDKLKRLLADNSTSLLSEISDHYFTERLYLLRSISPMIEHFQDKTHPFQKIYSEALSELPDLITTLIKQFEDSFKVKIPSLTSRGQDCTNEIVKRLSLQHIKEQCEILEIIFLYYSQFEMPADILAKLTKIFKNHGFGFEHPYCEVIDLELISPLLSCLNALEQVTLIEGFDMSFLQEPEASKDHHLSLDKKSFDSINNIIVELTDNQQLSPLLISWATVRYLLLSNNGMPKTQTLGERSIDLLVWRQINNIMSLYPFNTDSNIAMTGRQVFRGLFSCVTQTFHEDTLGDYSELVSMATLLLGEGKGLSGIQLDNLLFSAVGYFPLNIDPMLSMLSCMTATKESSMEVHAFISNLPTFSEYLATCGRDDVESLDDASYWRLLATKPIHIAGGIQTVSVPVGTVGHLVDSKYGDMVQWQHNVNGWKIFSAEIKSLLKYKGPSSNLDLLGLIQKPCLIIKLVKRILASMDTDDTGCMAVLETMEHFVAMVPLTLQKVIQIAEPPIELVSICISCLESWIKIQPSKNAIFVFESLKQIQYFPSPEQNHFNLQEGSDKEILSGAYGAMMTQCEHVNGCYPVTIATIDLTSTLLQSLPKNDEGEIITSQLSLTVQFILSDVFSAFHKWQHNDTDTWEKIGVGCLNLCHLILNSPSNKNMPESMALKQKVLAILSDSAASEVLLKLICIQVNALHALIAAEPFSLIVEHVTKTIRLGFSVLNNILRLEFSSEFNGKVKQGKLKKLLTHHTFGGSNVISVIAGYLYHRQTIALPLLSVSILRRLALSLPMSIHASLGEDVQAVRDVLLARLKARTEDHSLKSAILELFVVSVQTQPGLLELFLNLQLIDKDKPELGYEMGKSSCLSVVVDMMDMSNQGTYKLPTHLHTSCVKVLNSLWMDRKISAMQALTNENKGAKFWSSLFYPLFSENPPKDIANNELLETCANSLNVVALQQFYSSSKKADKNFEKVMKDFAEKKRVEHWSKVLYFSCKFLLECDDEERETHLMFASAWKTFAITLKLQDKSSLKILTDDILSSILLIAETDIVNKSTETVLSLLSSLLLNIVHQNKKKSNLAFDEIYSSSILCSEKLFQSSFRYNEPSSNLHAVVLNLIKEKSAIKQAEKTDDLIQICCENIKLLLWENPKPEKWDFVVEASVLLIGTLSELFVVKDIVSQSWIKYVSHESIINLLIGVLINITKSCHDTKSFVKDHMCANAILQMLVHISMWKAGAKLIQQTTNAMSELCLNIANVYQPKTNKKWLDLYHMNLVLMTRMIDSLSHDFLEDVFDFFGVHQDRMCQCMQALRVKRGKSLLQEISYTTAFLSTVAKSFTQQWKFKLRLNFENLMTHVIFTCHTSVSILLQPKLLQETLKLREKKHAIKTASTSSRKLPRQSSAVSLSHTSDETNFSQEVLLAQKALSSILGNTLCFLLNISPNICQVMFDQELDADEYKQLLAINFGSPSIEGEPSATFGTIISAANYALSTLHKMDASDQSQASHHDALTYVADTSLTLLMSQGMLLLKLDGVSSRNKQILRRELGDELSSCVKSATRHLRHSSNSYSPHSSPMAGSVKSAVVGNKGLLELASKFIGEVLR